MRKIILTVLLVFSTLIACGQEFRVLASKGNVGIQRDTLFEKVFAGKKLDIKDKLKVGDNAYIGLCHSSGKTMELKKPGLYDLNSLHKELEKQNAGLLKKYADYVVNETTKKSHEDLSKHRYKYMGVVGSVERGTEQIRVFSPLKSEIYSDTFCFKWEPNENVSVYCLEITNMFGEVVFKTETNQTSINTSIWNKLDSKYYIWSVYSKTDKSIKSDFRNISFLTVDKQKEIDLQVKQMKDNFPESALNLIVLASFFEDKKLLIDAMYCFERACQMEPEIDDFKIAYGLFMERNGIANPKE